ncbi:hypothetical protein [Mucilaginibacter ginkgonis]|uniref:Uncharacterized protein n=1 Tax=Mucilaginibacter ginkgonis TaxID=2682091 RepID=A0A6I4I1J3_9SPHI|nr:hypothetical protein [Mucilaginibacter ginkgonis]QQL50621.1 hypothetical protein GO620_003960 [Mucilaginibacter ginkgonis]
MKFRLIYCSLICFLLALSSCKKDSKDQNVLGTYNGIDATVIDAGNPASDGCGWMIVIDKVAYYADNLDEKYKKANLKVKISYDLLNFKYPCSLDPTPRISLIHLKSISTI